MLSRIPQVLISAGAGVAGCFLLCSWIEDGLFAKRYVMQQPMFEVIAQYNQCDVIRFTSGDIVDHFLDCGDKIVPQPNGQWNPGRIRVR